MTVIKLAKQLKVAPKFLEEKLTEMFLAQRLRLIESEIVSIGQKYGVDTVKELDQKITDGKLGEEAVGEDLFKLDHLLAQKSAVLPQWNLGI